MWEWALTRGTPSNSFLRWVLWIQYFLEWYCREGSIAIHKRRCSAVYEFVKNVTFFQFHVHFCLEKFHSLPTLLLIVQSFVHSTLRNWLFYIFQSWRDFVLTVPVRESWYPSSIYFSWKAWSDRAFSIMQKMKNYICSFLLVLMNRFIFFQRKQ